LSAGAAIAAMAAHGVPVSVLTVFAGRGRPPFSVPALRLHRVWELGNDPAETRRAEDQRAMARLGVRARHGDFPDVIYRRYPDGSWLVGDDGNPGREPEERLAARVRRWLREAIALLQPGSLLTCAAVGDHVDHRLTRDVALLAGREAGIAVRLWEDLPYAIWHDPLSAGPPDAGRPGVTIPPGAVRTVEVSGDEAWRAKYEAVAAYASQLRMLWPTGNFCADLDAHATKRAAGHCLAGRGEVFWTFTPAGGSLQLGSGSFGVSWTDSGAVCVCRWV
jgi:LmbE family N-acetylglucosaminyl deacetylase